MKKRLSIIAAIVLFEVNAFAFTLSEAVNEVISTNPDVVEKVKDYNALKNEFEQSYSGYYPTLDIEAEAGYERISNSSTNFETKRYNIDSARIVLRENIFEGFGTENRVNKSKSKLESAKFDYLYVLNEKAYETVEAYLNMLKSDAMSNLALENIKVHQSVLSDIKEKIDMNVGKVSEYDRVAGRLAMANSKYIIVQNDVKESVYFLHKLLGRFVDIEDLEMPNFDDELLPQTLEIAINKQFELNPQLKSVHRDLDVKKYDYEISKKEFYPKVDIEVSKSLSDNLSGVEGREDDFKAVVKMSYNILNGGYDYYQKEKMISNLHSQNEIQKQVKRTLLNDLQLSWVGYQVIDQQIPSLRKNNFYMKKTLKAYKEEYKLGKRNLINILDAENEYYNAKVQLLDAQFKLLLQKFKILKSQGTLFSDLQSVTFLQNNNIDGELITQDDTLPLDLDSDSDNILEQNDICENSLKGSDVASSGCDKRDSIFYINTELKSKKEKDIKSTFIKSKEELEATKIEKDIVIVLDYITFDENSIELSQESKKIMRILLTQLKKVSPNSYIELRVGSNDFKDEAKNKVLSTQRGYALKRNFLLNSVESNSINVFPITDNLNKDRKNYVELLVASDIDLINLNFTKKENTDIFFKDKSVEFKDSSINKLLKLSKEFKNLGDVNIDIISYTDEYVSALKNDELSAARAKVIKSFFEKNGVNRISFVPIGMGKYHEDLLFDIKNENQNSNIVEFVIR